LSRQPSGKISPAPIGTPSFSPWWPPG